VILQNGLQRMFAERENVFYYVTVMNENYTHPAMPEGVEEGIVRGIYPFGKGSARRKKRVQLLGSGAILREVIAAAELLEKDWKIAADVWSVTSFTELARDAQEVERWNRLHPMEKPRTAYVAAQLGATSGPVVAATDYMRLYAEQTAPGPGGAHLPGAGHRRLRPFRHPREAAEVLRGEPLPRGRGRAQGAGR